MGYPHLTMNCDNTTDYFNVEESEGDDDDGEMDDDDDSDVPYYSWKPLELLLLFFMLFDILEFMLRDSNQMYFLAVCRT